MFVNFTHRQPSASELTAKMDVVGQRGKQRSPKREVTTRESGETRESSSSEKQHEWNDEGRNARDSRKRRKIRAMKHGDYGNRR